MAEEKIAELTAEITDLKAANEEATAKITELEKTNETSALEIEALKTAAAAKAPKATDVTKALNAEIKDLKAEVKKLTVVNAKISNVVPGTYTSEEGSKYRFKKGHVKTRWAGAIVPSVDLLKNKEAMEYLIDINYGGLEIAD